ncbi:kallikrein-7 [Helicoverpa armigera]|nr:kallikrein-7 [Helicoverpa armigera]XP_047035867.1 kallikrein-7-like [Helicoverpa zea]
MMKTEFIFLHFLVPVVFVFGFITTCAGENVKKSVDENRDDNGETNDESKDESLDIPVENEPNNITCTRRQNSQMHEIQNAAHRQFPFMAAIMSQQNEYLCSGVVVSNGLILTTAHCTQQPLSYILLNTTTDKKDETTVSLHVIKTERFPTFTGTESLKDVGIVYTEKHNSSIATKVTLSNYTNPRNVLDLEGLGFGLNADVGQTKDLQYVGMENRSPEEITDVLRAYFDCVETKVPTCFKDTGGPVLFDKELMGIIIKGTEECSKEMSATYAVNKKMVDILPTYTFKAWLDEKIKKNEEQEQPALAAYPSHPAARSDRELHKMTSSGLRLMATPTYIFTGCVCILALY